ncbi:NB-ARC domain-containing protein [Asanoa sp. NPDC049573]|uniref:NB-ARC domain-containing protein n=1 Tax=Asanoa sp. NPDC049573 TaxID=3155396 RepID=UPI003422D0D7
MPSFGTLLRTYRIERRMTQETLAARSGVSSRSIVEMERGQRSPRQKTLEHLADALDLADEARSAFVEAGETRRWSARSDPVGHAPPSTPGETGPRQLPADLPDFVGYDEELAALSVALAPAAGGGTVVSISGAPGMGKTVLAVHLAHRVAAWYPDGLLYVPLGGSGPSPVDPSDALSHLLRTVTGEQGPGHGDRAWQQAAFRTALADRRILLVLDDASGYAQVSPLLTAGRSAVLVTSRLPLTGLPVTATVDLQSLPEPDALRLLGRIAGQRRIAEGRQAAVSLVRMCGGHPLAIRVLGARLAARPDWGTGGLLGQMADERHRLDEFRHGDLALRSPLEQAYRNLTPLAGLGFALLGGLRVSTFPEWVSSVLLDLDRPSGATVLQELLDARLLEPAGLDVVTQPRYRFHEVVALLARERHATVSPTKVRAALGRLLEATLFLSGVAYERLREAALTKQETQSTEPRCPERPSELVARRPRDWFVAEREFLSYLVEVSDGAGLHESAATLSALVERVRRLCEGGHEAVVTKTQNLQADLYSPAETSTHR